MIETIKEYLVGLGFSVDKGSYEKAKKAIDEVDKGLGKFAKSSVKNFAKASTAVAAFGLAAAAGMTKFLNGLGNQNIQMQILSRQLWTTQKQAYAFSLTLKAMGTNLRDLYLSPTLMQQYRKLHAATAQMATPGDYNAQMQKIQGLQLQIKQMRLSAYYALQWIGYYFTKYMAGPISKVHKLLASLNHIIIKRMPTWTRNVAKVMVAFMQAGVQIASALGSVYNGFKSIINNMPGWAKAIVAAMATISLAMKTTPFGRFLMGLTAILLLFNDFKTYLKGGKSMFGPFWAEMMKYKGVLKTLGKAVLTFAAAWAIYKGIILASAAAWKLYEWAIIAAVAIQGVFNDLMKVATGLQVAFNAVVDADPLVWIIAAIVAAIAGLVIGIIELIKHWSWVKRVAGDALNWIKHHLELLAPLLGPAGFLIAGLMEIIKHFGLLKQIAVAVWHDIETETVKAINGMITQINKLIKFIDLIPGLSIPQLHKLSMAVQHTVASAPYAYSSSSTAINRSTTVHANQTNNIYGSNANAIGNSVASGYNRNLHNLRGVIG